MVFIKCLLLLLCASLNEMNVLQLRSILINSSSFESIGNYSEEIPNDNSSITSIVDEPTDAVQDDAVFDNNYSQKMSEETKNTTDEVPSGPHYEASWTFCGQEEVRAIFSLFSLTKPSNIPNPPHQHPASIKLTSNMISFPSRSLHSLHVLKYYLFTIRQQKTNTHKILQMHQLIPKISSTPKEEYFSNSLVLIRLNPKEKYSVCIYYYQTNLSLASPDLFVCQDIMHDHAKHSSHGVFFILTQYSIILGILVILQGLFSMRKRRIAQILHEHFVNKTQRIRSTLSSVSLIRQSVSSMDTSTEPPLQKQHDSKMNQENQLKKRFVSSPAIINNPPPMDEREPFLKLTTNKNHVHFFFGLDEVSDDNESTDVNVEPYSDRPDALSSMAHIFESEKPWPKHHYQTSPLEFSQ